jgi:hypothetical protein
MWLGDGQAGLGQAALQPCRAFLMALALDLALLEVARRRRRGYKF